MYFDINLVKYELNLAIMKIKSKTKLCFMFTPSDFVSASFLISISRKGAETQRIFELIFDKIGSHKTINRNYKYV